MSQPLKVIVRPAADRDLKRQLTYLDENAGLGTALRFYSAALSSVQDLAVMPGMGTLIENRVLPGLRRWRVKGFEKILLFYYADDSAVHLLRVLHGAMDLEPILNDAWELLG